MSISLLSYANADIHTALLALNAVENEKVNVKAIKGIAAYHAQQAIEKIIKSEIYRVNPNINQSKMYTHKIYDLCAIASKLGVNVPREIISNAKMYSDWEAGSRYDLHFSVRVDSIKKAIKLAQNWTVNIK